MTRKKVWHPFKKWPFWVTFWLLSFFLLFSPWAWGAKAQLEVKIGSKTLLQEVSLLTRGTQSLVAVEELFPQIKGIVYYSPIMKKIHLAYGSIKWTIALDKGEAMSEGGEVLSLGADQVIIEDHTAYVAIPLLERFFGWQITLRTRSATPSSPGPSTPKASEAVSVAQTASSKNLLVRVRFYTYRDRGKTRVTFDFSKTPPLHEIRETESQIYLYLRDCIPDPGLGELVKIRDGRVGDVRVYGEKGKTVINISLEKPAKIVKGVLGGDNPRIFLDIMDVTEAKSPASAVTKPEIEPRVEEQAPAAETVLPENQINFNVVVIDPGHGGKDPGCVQNGYREKDIVLAISLKLKEALEARGFQVYLTRDRDVYPSLSERMQVANTRQPFAFLSIHCNSAPSPAARGVEIFVGDAHYQGEGAREVAARENQLFQSEIAPSSGSKVSEVLGAAFYLTSRKLVVEGLAKYLLDGITGRTGQIKRGVKTAPLIVLSDVLFPACLVEVGFLSNPAEAKKLASPAFQEQLAQGIAEGIVTFRNSPNLQKYASENGQ